jgi:hypothetical protein
MYGLFVLLKALTNPKDALNHALSILYVELLATEVDQILILFRSVGR